MGLQLLDFSQLLNFGRVAGSVVGDLEAQKGMDRLQSFAIIAGYLDFGAVRRFAVKVVNLVAELGHRGSSGRRGVVDEHGHVEVARGEALRDMR